MAAKLIENLRGKGVCATRPVYKPLHKYFARSGYAAADTLQRTAVSLPLYPDLKKENIRRILQIIYSTTNRSQ